MSIRPGRLLQTFALVGAVGFAAEARADVGISREANGCAYSTIADALANAIAGDDIWIAPGTYAESGLHIPFDLTVSQSNATCSAATIGAVVTIDGGGKRVFDIGVPGFANVIVGGIDVINGSTTGNGGVVSVDLGDLSLFFSTISGGHADGSGGCVYVGSGSAIRLSASTVTNCDADINGGAIAATGGTVELFGNSRVADSVAIGEGGGIWASSGFVNLRDDTSVEDNSADGGGGLCTPGTVVTMTGRATIASNEAVHGAGIIFPGDGSAIGRLVMNDDSSIVYNVASGGVGGRGAGVFLSGSEGTGQVVATLNDAATIATNNSSATGGGVEIQGNYNTLELNEGSSIVNNRANLGGGIFVRENGPGVANTAQVIGIGTLIDANVSYSDGGGAAFVDGTHSFVDSRITNNLSVGHGAGLFVGENSTVDLSVTLDNGCDPNSLPANVYCSEVSDNWAGGNGGGAQVEGEMTVQRTAFQSNKANKGAALQVVTSGLVIVENSLFALNDAPANSAAIQAKGTVMANHITVTDNLTVGLRFRPGSFGLIQRSIAFANTGSDLHATTAALPSSCNRFGVVTGTTVIGGFSSLNPLFVTTGRGDYRLGAASPALNQCSNPGDVDLDLRPRPGANSDQGTFER